MCVVDAQHHAAPAPPATTAWRACASSSVRLVTTPSRGGSSAAKTPNADASSPIGPISGQLKRSALLTGPAAASGPQTAPRCCAPCGPMGLCPRTLVERKRAFGGRAFGTDSRGAGAGRRSVAWRARLRLMHDQVVVSAKGRMGERPAQVDPPLRRAHPPAVEHRGAGRTGEQAPDAHSVKIPGCVTLDQVRPLHARHGSRSAGCTEARFASCSEPARQRRRRHGARAPRPRTPSSTTRGTPPSR
jgi:hypothetical protein